MSIDSAPKGPGVRKTPAVRNALVIGAALAALVPAWADVKITLKDGRVINVPVAPEEVQSITLEQGRNGAAKGLPPAPAGNLPGAPTFRADSPFAPPPEAPQPAPAAVAAPRPPAPVPAPTPAPASAPAAALASPGGEHIQVGPTRSIKVIGQAAGMAKPGDVIEIDAATYRGDVASWRASGITIRGVGGRVRLVADGASAEDKAIWVIKGDNVTVENIEFTGAAVGDGNGAGIRAEGTNLKLVGCFFHDNQEGILTSIDRPDSVVDIENSEFARDGGNEGRSHEIYIGPIKKLIVRGSYFHEGRVGHLIKTRAQENLIEGNRITNENADASYKIDVSNGGRTFIIGNLIEQGPLDENHTMIAYAMEGPTNASQELYVVNNTFVNDLGQGVFINSRSPGIAQIVNNIFVGGGNVFHGTGQLRNNLLAGGPTGAPKIEGGLFESGDIKQESTKTASDAGLVDMANFDYRLKDGSPAIGVGVDLGSAGGMSLLPTIEYVHPAHAKPVKTGPAIDIGAYQHKG
jgi:hypothetical protein